MDARQFVDKVREIVGYNGDDSMMDQIYQDRDLEGLHRLLDQEGATLETEYERGFDDGLEEAVSRVRMY